MRFPFLLLLAAAALPVAAFAATPPIFDVPRLEGIVIDGKGDDWGDRGFRVETLAGNTGMVYRAQDIDAGFRLGWDDQGLLVLATVHDDQLQPAEAPDRVAPCDSVELFLSAQLGSPEYYQLIAGPSAEDKVPGVFNLIKDRRVTPASPEFKAESAVTRTADGYLVEARIPWSSVGLQPAIGVQTAFQIAVNDADPGSRVKVTWYPSDVTIRESRDLHLLRLAEKPSRPIRMASAKSVDLGHPRLDVFASNALAGREVSARANGKVFATALFQPIGGARARHAPGAVR